MSANAEAIGLPLNPQQAASLETALGGLDSAQLQWVSGYAAGLAAMPLGGARPAATGASAGETYTILYGSQTGNGEAIARRLAADAEALGFTVRLQSLADFKPSALRKETLASFIISTHGEGDPPDDAELFHEFLLSSKAPKLEKLRYNVLALGDSSYVNFCQTGREFDQRLAELGAERLADIVELDVDYEAEAANWTTSTLDRLPKPEQAAGAVPQLRAVPDTPAYDRNNPFHAEVLTVQQITAPDSSKVVHHIELSLEDSGISYEPGDSLAVQPLNPPGLVLELLAVSGLQSDSPVTLDEEEIQLGEALESRLEVTALSLPFLKAWSALSGSEELAGILAEDRRDELAALLESHQVIDVLRQYPAVVDAQQLVDAMRRLAPRSYSIASSLTANPDEVHLTVAEVRYEAFGTPHWGAASTYLGERIAEGDRVAVFVEPNSRFRLPQDPMAPVVMIGPGTGVAPFSAFVEERDEQGAGGDNWLFFGERNFSSDFLYQVEWLRHLKSGALGRLDVAFSRDQHHKVYVQDRIRENADELARWLDNGAYLYVCGDAKRMAPDVHAALVDVLKTQKGLDDDAAEQFLKDLRQQGRYQRDVY